MKTPPRIRGNVGRRGPSRPLRIFLSHTDDLSKFPRHRSFIEGAISGILHAGHAVSDMAYFPTSDRDPADVCRDMVLRADLYAGIIGNRYGSVLPRQPELSYTEYEYGVAMQLGRPRLMFLIAEDPLLDAPGDDETADHRERQRAFRDRLRQEAGVIGMVRSPEDLEVKMLHALLSLPDLPRQ